MMDIMIVIIIIIIIIIIVLCWFVLYCMMPYLHRLAAALPLLWASRLFGDGARDADAVWVGARPKRGSLSAGGVGRTAAGRG